MNRVLVSSSNLVAVGYDSSSLTLEVEFKNGAVYQYFDVPPHEHEDLMRASSTGRHLNAHVKGVNRYVRL